jgi:hypothetical protein
MRDEAVGSRGRSFGSTDATTGSLGVVFLAQEFHDISGPVDYFILKTWMIFCAVAVLLLLVGLTAWLIKWWRNRPVTVKTPRERALEQLARIETLIDRLTPYEFSIRVSDILRRYVTDQYQLPVTRQTSVEFLNALTGSSPFSSEEQSLLSDFLNRCDLIKFARYNATTEDSRLLLSEADKFVRGGALEPA